MPRVEPRQPLRALAHPLWIAALALLVLNDHVLKGAEVLPWAVTGKLSDVAGLLVAPALLAALLGLRSRRALLAAHLLTGGVFAAINLSAAAAGAFEGVMALTPFPWAILVDPTDLLALPALALGWRVLVPAMERPRALRPAWTAAAWIGGAWACMATSPPPGPDPGDPWFPETWSNLAISNPSDQDLTVRIRRLKPTVYLDCALVAENPRATLSRELFSPAEAWIAEAGRAIALPGDGWTVDSGGCDAFLVDGSGVPMRLVFIEGDTWPATSLASTAADLDPTRALVIQVGSGFLPHPALFVAPPPLPAPAACALPDPMDALAWSPGPPTGTWTVEAIETAADGCALVELVRQDTGNQHDWYLCLGPVALPFEAAENLFAQPLQMGQDFQPIEGWELSGNFGLLRFARGGDVVPVAAFGGVGATPTEGCGYAHDACGDLVLPLTLAVEVGAAVTTLVAGESAPVADGGTFYLSSAVDIPVGDLECLPEGMGGTLLIESAYVEVSTVGAPGEQPEGEEGE